MEHDELRTARFRDAGGVIQHPDGHVELLAAFRMTHEAGDRSVDRQDDPRVAGERSEPLGPRVVHPELGLEVDLAGAVAELLQ